MLVVNWISNILIEICSFSAFCYVIQNILLFCAYSFVFNVKKFVSFGGCITSIQLTTSMYWPCYCTVHVSIVIHMCDSMWSFWLEASFLAFLYICIVVGSTNINITNITSSVNTKRSRHMTMKIQFLPLDSYNNVAGWKWLMGTETSGGSPHHKYHDQHNIDTQA
jgi:hypothetical protein